jgi:GR25 family glycosyltransferase involved in LPS biosynthesis
MKNIKYCIVSVDNRSINNIAHNKNILKDFQYVNNIDFIDGRNIDAFKILKEYGISIDSWNPTDKRIIQEMLNTEAATWVSNINIYKYIVLNNIDELLLIEDDVILDKNFVQNFKKTYKELKKNYDFLSFFYFENQNKEDDSNNLKLKYIQKSYNQKSGFLCMLFSNAGAKKILKYLEDNGIFYTNDCQVFKLSELGILNGYSIKPNTLSFVYQDQGTQSIIDPNNVRNNE